MAPTPQGECDLQVQFAPGLTQEQVHAVCDLIPGLDFCRFDRQSGKWN